MQSPYIPIKKTGWFYLWLALMAIGVWGEHHGYLTLLDSANLKLWSKTDKTNSGPDKLIRLLDINFDLQGLAKIQMLSNKYPKATFALIGHYSVGFIEQLSQPEYSDLADKSVLLSTKKHSSVSSITKNALGFGQLLSIDFLNPMPETKDFNWRASSQAKLAIQPANNTVSSQLIWRSGQNYYPSFIGQTIINAEQISAKSDISKKDEVRKDHSLPFAQLHLAAKNSLIFAQHNYHFGYRGEVYAIGIMPESSSYQTVIDNPISAMEPIILIDDLSINHSASLAYSLASLTSDEYIYSSWLTLSFKYLLLVSLIYGVYRMKKRPVRNQAATFISSIIILFLLQSFFVSQYLWLPLSLIILLSSMSWILQLGYNAEMDQFVEQHQQRNRLLADAMPVFYNTQNIESLLPHLEQSQPNLTLIDSVYEVAIEAEAHRNTSLAKRLHQWILDHNKRFSPSLERMSELAPEKNQESELEQTLVIDPDGDKITTQANSILNVSNFGRYQVDGILGKGAMGIVFQGVDPKINRYVAIKTLQLSDELDGQSLIDTKQRFFREAETAGNLSHANIVTIYDVGEEQQANSNRSLGYIAMDLLTGAPLSEFVKKGKLLPPSLVYQLMIQMADALDYAHRQKVIHRDIKPANIIYDDDLQRGTLTDFGIAYMSDHSKTKTGTIMGSPYYMSPEQILGTKIDGRSDIFSLGVTFYQLLSGHLPFTGESIASVAFHITKTKHESVKKWNNKLPSSATRITNKAMQKEPDKRFQNMQEFKQASINALKRDYKKSPLI